MRGLAIAGLGVWLLCVKGHPVPCVMNEMPCTPTTAMQCCSAVCSDNGKCTSRGVDSAGGIGASLERRDDGHRRNRNTLLSTTSTTDTSTTTTTTETSAAVADTTTLTTTTLASTTQAISSSTDTTSTTVSDTTPTLATTITTTTSTTPITTTFSTSTTEISTSSSPNSNNGGTTSAGEIEESSSSSGALAAGIAAAFAFVVVVVSTVLIRKRFVGSSRRARVSKSDKGEVPPCPPPRPSQAAFRSVSSSIGATLQGMDWLDDCLHHMNKEPYVKLPGPEDDDDDGMMTIERLKDDAEFQALPLNQVGADALPEGVLGLPGINRYRNILPNPDTRFKLCVDCDPQGKLLSDPPHGYINANIMRGWNGMPGGYIAAQGPTPQTMDHFWHMIWQADTRAIVMVTNVEERGRVKCARYWPEQVSSQADPTKGQMVFGELSVVVTAASYKDGYRFCTLQLTRGAQTRTLHHFWYHTWPDYGVPQSTSAMISLLADVRGVSNTVGRPWVVHCSAGIGRTGTILAIDIGIRLLNQVRHTSVSQLIRGLRADRGGMVQTAEQGAFVQRALLDYAEHQNKLYAEDMDLEASDASPRGRIRMSQGGAEYFLSFGAGQKTDALGPVHESFEEDGVGESIEACSTPAASIIHRRASPMRRISSESRSSIVRRVSSSGLSVVDNSHGDISIAEVSVL